MIDVDPLMVENVGNLVCPAMFDLGEALKVVIISVTEGDDKPLKYPLMFSIVDVLLVNKMDAIEMFDFDLDILKERVKKLNPKVTIIPISAKNGQGIDEWADWLRNEVRIWNQR